MNDFLWLAGGIAIGVLATYFGLVAWSNWQLRK